ncbi:GumC family protein [Nonlabens xiamenensis]|uniref:GumC family protein n=1 Tax=Nonlabens xiamenensis TaxID=2341043 RepID=UPI000F60E2B1|nr:polysaccharide biosynthesis tyrosine autokinase [Nonlabens xiamenensis]
MVDQQQTGDSASKSLQEQIAYYLKSWPWFFLSVFICVGLGYLYLRYATKLYQAEASIIIKDTQSGGGLSEVGALGDLDVLGNSFNTVENEVEILKSNRLLENVVKELNLQISYIRSGNVKTSNVYNDSPVLISIINDSIAYRIQEKKDFFIKPLNPSSCLVKVTEAGKWETVDYGATFVLDELEMLLIPNLDPNAKKDDEEYEIHVKIQPIGDVVRGYSKKINVSKSDRRGSVVNLSITDPVRQKAEDLLNQLVVEYNEDAIADKNQVAKNTADFIDERLAEVQRDLDSIEKGIEKFKDSKNLTDLTAESLISLEQSSGLGREAVMAQTQLQIARSILSRLKQADYQIIPENLGFTEFDINAQTSKYNALLVQYKNLLQRGTAENPAVIRLKTELDALNQAMTASLESLISKLEIQRRSIESELRQVTGKISNVPENERLNRDIERTRRVVEAIYVLLSERKETTAISLAITAPKAKIIDFAFAPLVPVSPQPKIVLLATFVLGLLIPFGILYVRNLLYNKIESRNDIQKALPNLAILGEIPKLDTGDSEIITKNDRSILAEAFRILRTNLQFKLSTLEQSKIPIIMVTSTVKGEGKTFVAYNLASTLAFSGKRVLLIGADIRNPQIHRYAIDGTKRSTKGVTEYLTDSSLNVVELAQQSSGNQNLQILLSGAIPPNPAELWMQDRTSELFKEAAASYDVVIVDTAPTMLVTDTLLINHHADITVYVSRANYTETQLLEYVKDSVEAEKIKNVAMVINSVKLANFGYGNKYGYTYSATKETFWDKVKEKFTRKKTDF